MILQNSTKPTYYQVAFALKEWTGEGRPNLDEEAMQLVGLPGGPNDGGMKVLCEAPANQAIPVFVEPYAFLEALSREMRSHREKHSPEWESLIIAPERMERARAFRKVRS